MKNLNVISKLSVFIGCIIILGTAGASDLGTLSFKGILSGVLWGSAFIISGKFGLFMFKTAKRKNTSGRTREHSSEYVLLKNQSSKKTYAGKTIRKLPRKRPFAA